VEIFIVWLLVWGLLGAAVARERSGETIGGFVLGAFLGPIGILIAYVHRGSQRNVDKQKARLGLVQCTHCAEFIRPEAKVCRFCSRDVQPRSA
jgi:hypothetical protein